MPLLEGVPLALQVRQGEGRRPQAVGGQTASGPGLTHGGDAVLGQERPVEGVGHPAEVQSIAGEEGVAVPDGHADIGLGKASTDVALKVLDQSPVGDAAGSLADRLEPAAERGRRQREATAEQVEAVVGQVVDEVVGMLNIDGIVNQVDIDGIVKKVDIDGIVKKVDIDDIISRVDVDGIVRRTEVGTLIVQSTGGIVTQLLDFVRSLGVTFDDVSDRIVDRVLRRGRQRPVAPVLLRGSVPDGVVSTPAAAVATERPA